MLIYISDIVINQLLHKLLTRRIVGPYYKMLTHLAEGFPSNLLDIVCDKLPLPYLLSRVDQVVIVGREVHLSLGAQEPVEQVIVNRGLT